MSRRTYHACHQPINDQHGSPPTSFLDQLIDTIHSLPDEVFAENRQHDVYAVMLGALGPYTSLLHRRAVLCEVLRVEAGFESDWNWNEGVDTTNPGSLHHLEAQETGAFQVSADSMSRDPSLPACVDRYAGKHDVRTFIKQMKANHALAVEYVARLLRFDVTWCGTIIHPRQVMAHVRRDAVAEFQSFLGGPASSAAPPPATADGTLFPPTSPCSGVADLYDLGVRFVLHKIGQWKDKDAAASKRTYLKRKAEWLRLGGAWGAYYLPYATGEAAAHLQRMHACEPDPAFFRAIDWEPESTHGPTAPQATISALAGLLFQKYGRYPLKYGSRILLRNSDPVLDHCEIWLADPNNGHLPKLFDPYKPPAGRIPLWQWTVDGDPFVEQFKGTDLEGVDFSAFDGTAAEILAKFRLSPAPARKAPRKG
jgi:hypothetical protein